MGREFNVFKTYSIRKSMWGYDIVLEEDKDAYYIFPSVLDKLDDFLGTNNLNSTWKLICYFESQQEWLEQIETEEKAKKRAQRFVSPDTCLEYIKANDVIGLIEAQKPECYKEMLEQLHVLIKYWEQGYYIYSWG